MSSSALFVAVFLACVVEAVEALTIVLAAGSAREWRSTGQGLGAAVVTLAVVVTVLGPAITAIPLSWLRVFIGGLLLVFGLQWVRKAVLRASGFKGLHDEAALFEEHRTEAAAAAVRRRGVVHDWYAFTLSYKGVLLEGLEVVFIVLTFGANQHQVPLAAGAAAAAVLVVAALGVVVKAPLTRVPENWLKMVVGVMLTSFGMFWSAEGAGARWPGSDAALLVIVPAVAAVVAVLVLALRRVADKRRVGSPPAVEVRV